MSIMTRIRFLLLGALLGVNSTSKTYTAEPAATSEGALIEPTLVEFGELAGDATYVFFFNAIKGGASTALAGNDTWGLKLEQWPDTLTFGTTEFGVVDNLFDPDGQGLPESIFETDVHVAFVNDTQLGEVRLYVNGARAGFYIGNFELSGEAKVMAARIEAEADPMGDGSILYSWATYNEALSDQEIATLAANAEPVEPPDPGEPEEPLAIVASSTYPSLTPNTVNFGNLWDDASYEFFFKAAKGGPSTAIAGNDKVALKLDQWNEQGVFGVTVFGVADYIFEPNGEGLTDSIFDQDVHVIIVNDLAAEESRLYVDGNLVGVLGANFELKGQSKVMAAQLESDIDAMGEGSVMYRWATYNSALPEDMIAELAAAAIPFDPTGPFTAPTIVDFGTNEGDVSFEFFFNALKNGPSTAIAGNDNWGLKLEQWGDTGLFGLTEFGVIDNTFILEGSGSDASIFEEDTHVVFVNDVTRGEVWLYVNGEYVGFIPGNFDLSGPTKLMAARLEQEVDVMGAGSILYYWDVHPSALTLDEIADLYRSAEPREPTHPVEPVDPPEEPEPPTLPDGALGEPTLVDFGSIFGDATYEFAFKAVKGGASTAIAGNDAWGLKLDQWPEQGVFGMTEFGVADHLFEADGPASVDSVFDKTVHVVFANDITNGQTRLYVNGLYAGFINVNFDLSGEGKVMAARIEQDTDPMGAGSIMYGWSVHEGLLSENEIMALADAYTTSPANIESLSREADGTLTIEYSGTLHSSETITGDFTPIEGAESPYMITPEGASRFYLVR